MSRRGFADISLFRAIRSFSRFATLSVYFAVGYFIPDIVISISGFLAT